MDKWIRNLALILVVLMALTACGTKSEQPNNKPNEQQGEQPDGQDEAAMLAIENGYIVKIDSAEQRVLITEYRSVSGQESITPYWFKVDGGSELLGENGSKITFGDLTIGTRVQAWNIGAVAESYPMQAAAAKIAVQAPVDGELAKRNGLQTAIQAAIESDPAALAWAVKDVKRELDNNTWTISIVSTEKIREPFVFVLHIDAESGNVVEKPLMENDAFRLFAPKPESIAGGTIKVRGQARVFEAAFSWRLEDGHNVLAEGHEMTDMGAPEWGNFEFEVTYKEATNPNLTLILYEASAKDGSPQHELFIPLKADEKLIKQAEE